MSEQLIRMTKCLRDIHIYDEALWPTCPFCPENRRVADELQRLRAENAALNTSLQATYDERQEVLGELRAELAALKHDIESYVQINSEIATANEAQRNVIGDLHAALGIKWGDDPYAAIAALQADARLLADDVWGSWLERLHPMDDEALDGSSHRCRHCNLIMPSPKGWHLAKHHDDCLVNIAAKLSPEAQRQAAIDSAMGAKP